MSLFNITILLFKSKIEKILSDNDLLNEAGSKMSNSYKYYNRHKEKNKNKIVWVERTSEQIEIFYIGEYYSDRGLWRWLRCNLIGFNHLLFVCILSLLSFSSLLSILLISLFYYVYYEYSFLL